MMDKFLNLFKKKKDEKVLSAEEKYEALYSRLNETPVVSILFGDYYVQYIDKILDKVSQLRENVFQKTGFIIPLVNFKNDSNLQEEEILVKVLDRLVLDRYFTVGDDIADIICDLLEKVCFENIEYILTNEAVEKYINEAYKKNYYLMCDILRYLPNFFIKNILLDILNAKKSIKNIDYIFEIIGEYLFRNGYKCHFETKIDIYEISYYVCKRLGNDNKISRIYNICV